RGGRPSRAPPSRRRPLRTPRGSPPAAPPPTGRPPSSGRGIPGKRSASSPPNQEFNLSALSFDLLAQAGFRRPELAGRVGRCEVFGLEQRANLDLALLVVGVGAALDPIDGLLQGLHLPEPEAGDQLFRLGERPV